MQVNCTICASGWHYPEGIKTPCPVCRPAQKKKQYVIPRYKRVKQQSEKRAAIEAEHIPLREAIKKAVGRCDFCGTVRPAKELQEHHIGRNRWREIDNPRRCAVVCHHELAPCHQAMDDLEPAEQIAIVARAMKRAVQRVMK